MASTRFELKQEDLLKLQLAMKEFDGDVEQVVNDYLEHEVNEIFRESIVNLIPVSKINKKNHAKTSNPLIGEMSDNLTLYIHTKTKYNYLYFPQNAEGTSKGKTPNDFMEEGLNAKYDEVVNGILEKLQTRMEGI